MPGKTGRAILVFVLLEKRKRKQQKKRREEDIDIKPHDDHIPTPRESEKPEESPFAVKRRGKKGKKKCRILKRKTV